MNATPLSCASPPGHRQRSVDLLEGVLLAIFICCWAVGYVGLCPPDPARPAHHRVQA